MPPERDAATILDLLLAASRIGDFVAGLDFEGFCADLKSQSAVTLQILILGEAAKRLSPELRTRLSTVEWSGMMRMRDKLIHHYEDIDPAELWRTATRDVPALITALEPLRPRD